jgi:hypothetical protein
MSEAAWQQTGRDVDELAQRLADDFLRQALDLVGLKSPERGA